MDIERGILKSLFYDYPIDALVRLLDKHNGFVGDTFMELVPQLLRWRERCFTNTETTLMKLRLQDEWHASASLPDVYSPFVFLQEVAPCWLKQDANGMPQVRFDNLFRWKDVVLYVGEDLLTTAYLASCDVRNQSHSYHFLWDDILHHDNETINNELKNGLTDLHAHFNASSDVFHLNWLNMMNNVRSYDGIKSADARKINVSQDIDLAVMNNGFNINLRQMCVAAAALRHMLFCILLDGKQYDKDYQETISQVLCILKHDIMSVIEQSDIQSRINISRQTSLKTRDGRHVDYCLQRNFEAVYQNSANINILFQGERALMYEFFYRYYSKERVAKTIAPYFYLYVLLKSHIRREFVQINELKGFENFEKYQDRKDLVIPDDSVLADYIGNITLQTCIRSKSNDYVEVRLTPNHASIPHDRQIGNNMFGAQRKNVVLFPNKHIGITVHFIKENYVKRGTRRTYMHSTASRFENYRKSLKIQLDSVLKRQKRATQIPIVGIDAASTEMFCRPEVFGHVFRYAKRCGLRLTYHVGEDFFDIVDGLRAIDEAVLFLQLDADSRIGHALVMGIGASDYYKARHCTTIMPQQNLLDNCVWLLMRSQEWNITLPPVLVSQLTETATQLYNTIGYNGTFELYTYWHSMLLRGDEPYVNSLLTDRFATQYITPQWEQAQLVVDERLRVCTQDTCAYQLYMQYHFNTRIKHNGERMIEHKWNKVITKIVTKLQKAIQQMIAQKRISIECCPTSNLKIGFIDRYDEHPMLTHFYPVNADASYPLLRCSINTDDRGVFYTSIYEEYSLIALALYKKKKEKTDEPMYNEREILRYIHDIRENARLMAFRNH